MTMTLILIPAVFRISFAIPLNSYLCALLHLEVIVMVIIIVVVTLCVCDKLCLATLSHPANAVKYAYLPF